MSGIGRTLVDPAYAAGRRDGAVAGLEAARERMRQVHARHDLHHVLGAWPRLCALCEAAREVVAMTAAAHEIDALVASRAPRR